MDPELEKMIKETRALARDNHRILRSIRRHQLLSSFGRFIIWFFVLIAAFYAYEAYLKPIAHQYGVTPASGLSTFADLQKLLNSSTTKQ